MLRELELATIVAPAPSLSHNRPPAALRTPPAARRRSEPRSAYRVPCRIECVDDEAMDTTLRFGLTVNLSPSGLAVHLAEPLSPETIVVVTVPRPDGPNLCATGRVLQCRRVLSGTFEVGIQFVALP